MEEHKQWLQQIIPLHERLTDVVVTLLQNILSHRSIDYLSVAGRTKSVDSAFAKIERKKYKEPRLKLTDISGIRVVTFLESQVHDVTLAIKETFSVDAENSMDRTQVLGSDRIGYRSTHFVCTLGEKRKSLIEYRELTALKFEVQVRTVLQHAWAELAHDRSFKFNPGLPQHIQRKLNLYSGMLEVIDAGFDSIAKEIDVYVKEVDVKNLNQIGKVDIDRVSLERFMGILVDRYDLKSIDKMEIPTSVIDELKRFGVSKIDDLRAIVTTEFIEAYKDGRSKMNNTYVGFLRDIMMFSDIEKYFSGPVDWGVAFRREMDFLFKKWGLEKVRRLLRSRDIELDDDDEGDE